LIIKKVVFKHNYVYFYAMKGFFQRNNNIDKAYFIRSCRIIKKRLHLSQQIIFIFISIFLIIISYKVNKNYHIDDNLLKKFEKLISFNKTSIKSNNKNITIYGMDKIDQNHIFIKIKSNNINTECLECVKTAIKSIILAEDVIVKKINSNNLILKIKERNLTSLIQLHGDNQYSLLDSKSNVIDFNSDILLNYEKDIVDKLIRSHNIKDVVTLNDFIDYLSSKNLIKYVDRIDEVYTKRFNITLKNGIQIKLPRDNYKKTIGFLFKIKDFNLDKEISNYKIIDSRIAGKIFYQ
jgi:hypothetical protein